MDDVLATLREKHQLPLIQLWVPSMYSCPEAVSIGADNTCNSTNVASKITELLTHSVSVDWNLRYASELYQMTLNAMCLVEVAKAYSLKKACFLADTSELSISSYPLVHVTRSCNLNSSFAIPCTLIHPDIPPLVLEVFLPTRKDCDENLGNLLKTLLSTVAQELSVHNADFGLNQYEEFYVKISHMDDDKIVHLDVSRSVEIVETEDQQFPLSSSPPPTSTINASNNEIDDATAGEKNSDLSDALVIQDKADAYSNLSLNTNMAMTLDNLVQHSGEKLEASAAELGVARPALKRLCRELGTYWWPLIKRNKIGQRSTDKAREEEAAVATSNPSNAKDTSVVPEKDTIDHKYDIVKATYRDDIVKFPVCSNIGLEALRTELEERFDFNGERFKIKYEDGGHLVENKNALADEGSRSNIVEGKNGRVSTISTRWSGSFINSDEALKLPEDIVIDILARLPVKCLMKFQCVCKDWCVVMRSPYFKDVHFNHPSNKDNFVILINRIRDAFDVADGDPDRDLHSRLSFHSYHHNESLLKTAPDPPPCEPPLHISDASDGGVVFMSSYELDHIYLVQPGHQGDNKPSSPSF
ncbi:OLC1v1011317C1 [Oldenlandia corymbosa var. corymbosa]|uniref:OLC1v1011317C1 n=1 Tax=Oldenlandia corymbosa var. corymbosa TaxID=529605 RepID=A0AAV1DVR7_OLDCO|nr:OLC1v1011317C1 [Oldenlandia corymbosa var. corymbosa]